MGSDARDYYDYCDTDEDIGYQMLVDKHINIYEPLFDENERYYNRYKHIEQVITIAESDNEKTEEEPKAQEKQQQTTNVLRFKKISKNIDKNLSNGPTHDKSKYFTRDNNNSGHKRNGVDIVIEEETTESKEREKQRQTTNNGIYVDQNLSKARINSHKPKNITDDNNRAYKRNSGDIVVEETKESKHIDNVITLTDSDNEESDESIVQKINEQTTSIEKNQRHIDKNLSQVRTLYDRCGDKPKNITDNSVSKSNSNSDGIVVIEKSVESKPLEEVITITDNDNEESRDQSITDNEESDLESKAQEKQQQTASNGKDIDPNFYKVRKHHDRFVYTCQWSKCQYETYSNKSLEYHILNEHMRPKTLDSFSRSFVSLNVYQYKCTHSAYCYYTTTARQSMLYHAYGHNKCSFSKCGERFATRHELTAHESRHYVSAGTSKHVSSAAAADKRHLCAFNLNDSDYLTGKGVCCAQSIKQYYQKRMVSDGNNACLFRYRCLWSKCGFETSNCDTIQEHVHNKHTCPLI